MSNFGLFFIFVSDLPNFWHASYKLMVFSSFCEKYHMQKTLKKTLFFFFDYVFFVLWFSWDE